MTDKKKLTAFHFNSQTNDINQQDSTNKSIGIESVDLNQQLNTSNVIVNKPKYTQAKTLFNIDLDNSAKLNKLMLEKQWTKTQTLNFIIREYFKNQGY